MPANIAPQASPAPQQVTNSYAAGATGGAPTSPVAPGATIPDPAAAMNAAIVAGAGAAVASSVPDRRALPPNAPPLGFEGYCPVSMRNHWKWLPGDPRWGVVHRGRTYWFVGQSEQQRFWADPDRYSPALSGMDPVLAVDHRQQVPGKREHSLDYDNLFYMFASEATLQQFSANPQRYATSVRQAMGIPRGRLVQ
jgi:protein disulfide-isomerase